MPLHRGRAARARRVRPGRIFLRQPRASSPSQPALGAPWRARRLRPGCRRTESAAALGLDRFQPNSRWTLLPRPAPPVTRATGCPVRLMPATAPLPRQLSQSTPEAQPRRRPAIVAAEPGTSAPPLATAFARPSQSTAKNTLAADTPCRRAPRLDDCQWSRPDHAATLASEGGRSEGKSVGTAAKELSEPRRPDSNRTDKICL